LRLLAIDAVDNTVVVRLLRLGVGKELFIDLKVLFVPFAHDQTRLKLPTISIRSKIFRRCEVAELYRKGAGAQLP
jgi:hypothetical protein